MDISSNDVDTMCDDNTMSEKVKELELENEDLMEQVGGLIVEAREARRSFTAFQIAVSFLVFVYGMMYGAYFGKCM
jgi:hypothetical protein